MSISITQHPTPYQLRIRHCSVERQETLCFQPVSWDLSSGETAWITGHNGAGKSSLLKAIAGLFPPDSSTVHGSIEWLPHPPPSIYLGHSPGLHPHGTVQEELLHSYLLYNLGPVTHAEVHADLALLDLAQAAHKPVRALSAGQRQKLALLKLWRAPAAVWILDEPFVSLDAHSCNQLIGRWKRHVQSGGMVIGTTHQMPDAVAQLPHHTVPLMPYTPQAASNGAET